MTTTIFGLQLGKAVTPGEQIPNVLDQCLQVLAYCVPANSDIFEMPLNHPEVISLRSSFDEFTQSQQGDSPVTSVENPQVLLIFCFVFSL